MQRHNRKLHKFGVPGFFRIRSACFDVRQQVNVLSVDQWSALMTCEWQAIWYVGNNCSIDEQRNSSTHGENIRKFCILHQYWITNNIKFIISITNSTIYVANQYTIYILKKYQLTQKSQFASIFKKQLTNFYMHTKKECFYKQNIRPWLLKKIHMYSQISLYLW